MAAVGTQENPLRVAIIGSGPSGFYTVSNLLKQSDLVVEMDMFDRLPTPYGLVRAGVAPDHQKDKSVTRAYEKSAAHPGFRFFGNVEYGTHIHMTDLKAHYHQVMFLSLIHISEPTRLGMISYAVFCLKKKKRLN